MRRIKKGEPVTTLTEYVEKNAGANWDTFHQDARDCYLECRTQILIEEQNCLCGYTEISITEITDSHLDHYRKKSIFPDMTFVWKNLVAATLDSDFGANYKDSVFKIKKENYPEIFDPVEDDVQTFLYYNQRGEIEPLGVLDNKAKEKVKKTIEVFNLNHSSLRSRRETMIRQIRDCAELAIEQIMAAFSASGFQSVLDQEITVLKNPST